MILVQATYDQGQVIANTPIEGSVAANDRFGEGLGFVAGKTERSILIGCPMIWSSRADGARATAAQWRPAVLAPGCRRGSVRRGGQVRRRCGR